ncbi:MAG: hypothetical protein ACPGU1_06930 [Myxococcota bacterium]
MRTWTEEELTSHGVALSDEGLHPYAPGDSAWNESLFFDWIDAESGWAGHCRIGRHTGLGHLWVWVYLYDGERWVGFDEPALDLELMSDEGWAYESEQLSLSWRVDAPLSRSTLEVSGRGRVLEGTDPGDACAFALALTFDAAGPAHGMAARRVKARDGATYDAGRYEQPCDVSGVMTLDAVTRSIRGRGERDHSWGPRHWAMQWLFLVLEGETLRAQCTEVLIGGAMRICVGYVLRDAMAQVNDARFELTYADEAEVLVPFEGTVAVDSDGGGLVGRVIPISGVALNDGHCLPEGVRSIYRRNLVRFEPADGGPPIMGWMETHRLVSA